MSNNKWRGFTVSRVGKVFGDVCPCNNCRDERTVGCHGKCRKYIIWRMLSDRRLNQVHKKELADKAIKEYFVNRLSHERKSKHIPGKYGSKVEG